MQNASDVTNLVKIAENFRFTTDGASTEHHNLENGFPDPIPVEAIWERQQETDPAISCLRTEIAAAAAIIAKGL
jgi:hypothetical protein